MKIRHYSYELIGINRHYGALINELLMSELKPASKIKDWNRFKVPDKEATLTLRQLEDLINGYTKTYLDVDTSSFFNPLNRFFGISHVINIVNKYNGIGGRHEQFTVDFANFEEAEHYLALSKDRALMK